MAIRWKSKYNFVIWLLVLCLGINSVLISIGQGSKYFLGNYFQSSDFRWQVSDFVDTLRTYERTIDDELPITQEEIEEYRFRFGDLSSQISSINEQYETRINEAKESGNKELEEFFTAERDEKIADITKNFTDDDHVIEKIKEEKEAQINENRDSVRSEYLHFKENIKYYLEDTETNNTYTNVNLDNGLGMDELFADSDVLFKGTIEDLGLGYETLTGTIVILEGSVFQSDVESYKINQMIYYSVMVIGIISLIFAFSFYKKMKNSDNGLYKKWRNISLRMPIDFRLFGIVFFSIIFAALIEIFENTGNDLIILLLLAFFVGVPLLSAILLQGKFLIDDLRNWDECKKTWKESLIYRCVQLIQGVFENRTVATKVIAIILVMTASGFGLPLAFLGWNWTGGMTVLVYIALFLLITIPTFIYTMKKIAYFNKITAAFEKISNGRTVPDLKIKGTSTLASLAENINHIKEEIKCSKKEQVKSERLKTELITNVSHDLRTPLTSIITYTDLLKKEDISTDERNAYLEIIDRKSKRLKVLIDDLFEVSKMATGNIELQRETVDIVQLLQQSLAEYDEKISQTSLQFRVSHENKPLYATVDGPKIWRVFENLISNALKYSMDSTRVYISTAETEEEVVITFKNISKYESGDNIEELLQRFKRGDASRHTDGSGLGLAIAQSIIDLHGGSLQLEVDGDLFKATIHIPKSL